MKALVVEDDKKLARLLVRVLTEEGYVVDTCGTGADALRNASTIRYDLVLLDRMLPEGDGLSVCRELRASGNTVPVLVLTARGEVSDRVLGLEAGADDYLTKPFHTEELLARARAVQRRMAHSFATMRVGALEIQRNERRALLDGRALDLTAREYALLLDLVYRPNRVVTRSDLLTRVWESRIDPGSNTVDVHVSNLREKLGGYAWMIETVRGQGYRLRAQLER